jgi:AP-1 complex subunit gamma-1
VSAVKQFIRNVRAAKTIADERAVIQKESASIRASFREESGDHNVRCARDVNESHLQTAQY